MKKEIKSQSFWHLICQNWSSIDDSMVPQRWKVHISIVAVAVNHIEVIDDIDWLHDAINIFSGGFEPLISSCWFFLRNPVLLFLNLICQCAEMNRWVFYTKNVQFENVSFFIKVSDEEKLLLIQYCEITGKSAMLSYWYAWCKNVDSW